MEPFTSKEQQLFELLVPHIIETYKTTLRHHLLSSDSASSVAVCDINGALIDADDGFIDKLKREFVDWERPWLPSQVIEALLRDKLPVFSGKKIIITSRLDRDLFCLKASRERRNKLLSKSERLVTKHLVKGLPYKEVAKKLNISPSTVTNHVNRIYKKLGIQNKAQLSAHFVEHSNYRDDEYLNEQDVDSRPW